MGNLKHHNLSDVQGIAMTRCVKCMANFPALKALCPKHNPMIQALDLSLRKGAEEPSATPLDNASE